MPLKQLGYAVPVIAMTFAGCTESDPMQRYTLIYTAPTPDYTPPVFRPAPVVPSFVPRAEAAAPVNDPPPLRPIGPDPAPAWHWPSWHWPSWGGSAPSADDGACTGWWSICHFFPR